MPAPARRGPLAGLTVLELGNVIAAPTAGCLMGDFGAHVIKVEHPVHGDDLRNWPPQKDGEPLWWRVTNRNKSLITLDVGTPEGQAAILRIVAHVDILIENFRPGTMERWGLAYERLAATNPRLIMVRISGYGQTGPYAPRPGFGTVAEAMSGAPAFTGFPDKPPTLSAFPLVDALAGAFAVQGALMAVYERDVAGSGTGQVVDVSLYEPLFRLIDPQIICYDQLGIVKRRNGNRMDEDSPRNVYATSDGEHVAISAGSQRTFARLATAIGRPELNADPRFCTTTDRVRNADVLDEIVAEWFRARTLEAAMRELEAADVVAGPVYDVRRLFADPHVRERENIIALDDPQLGTIRMQGVVPKLSRTPGAVSHPGGAKGRDTRRILHGFGFDDGEIETLARAGVI